MPRLLPRRTRPSATVVAAAATVACLALTACGSNLDPQQVAAGRGVDTAGSGAAAPGASADGTVPGADDGGVPADPGDGSVPDSTGSGNGTPPASGDAGAGSGGAPGDDGTSGDASGDGDSGDGDDDTPDDNSPTGGRAAGDCDGFTNTTGITDSEITIANASDISGPVPGLFESARQGTQAFVSYYNSTEKLCGRSLKLLPLDSRADAGADQQAYATACEESFAAVGSVSSFDAGGAATAERCDLPDIRGFTVTPERQKCSTCRAAYAISSSTISDTIPKFWLKKEPEASKHVGIFYVNVAASKVNAEAFRNAYERAGMNVDVLQPIDTAEFNYATYAQQMKDNDIQFVQYFGPYQFAIKLQQAMKQQSFTPKVYFQDPTIYDANYLKQAGDVAKGVYVFSTTELFDNTGIREMALYRSWLDQVAPGAVPNYYGLYAWSAARLFVEQATALGGKLSRTSLVSSLAKVKGWTSNGLHAPMAVGAGTTSPCAKILQYSGSSWSSVSGRDFTCGSLVNAT